MPTVQRIGLIGLRLGASFAASLLEAGAESPRLRSAPLVLWDPILDGDAYFQELLRSNLSTQLAVYGKVVDNREVLTARIRAGGTVNVDGFGDRPNKVAKYEQLARGRQARCPS